MPSRTATSHTKPSDRKTEPAADDASSRAPGQARKRKSATNAAGAAAGTADVARQGFPLRSGPRDRKPVEVPGDSGTGRKYNVRPDTLDFRDRMYISTLVEVSSTISLDEYLKLKVPVLNQGTEGACTGFALATVANCLLRKRKQVPDETAVSARMFYELARRYDEWPGEDYSGSSARGAMKGWHKHGVCADNDWPYYSTEEKRDAGFTERRMCEAKKRPLGAYYRVNHKDLIAMHSAISEVGVLYATSVVHRGWEEVGKDGVIEYSSQALGGHAFAIVAYDEYGFWIQNSWGEGWGKKGMARVSYDDWLENGTDVWVARLGAPVVLDAPRSTATAHAKTSGLSVAYTFADLRPHVISVGNQGRLRPGGDYGTTAREVETIFEEDIPRLLKGHERKRLLLYAHGGLVDERAAVQRVAEYRATLLGAGIYPLAFIWHSDYWTTITNVLEDAVRRRRPEGWLDKAKDFMLDRLDDALEPLARRLTGKSAWDEMKENALLAGAEGGAADVVVGHIRELRKKFPDLEVHVVGHSAGSIFNAPLVQLLAGAGAIQNGPAIKIASCTLWAPACTVELFKQFYMPLIESKAIERFAIFCLTDEAEQGDNCAKIYNKSLLYMVSNAFEATERIPGVRCGVPILGMENAIRGDADISRMVESGAIDLVLAPNREAADSMRASKASHHGDFDDDEATVRSTFDRIVGPREGRSKIAARKSMPIVFKTSASRLRTKRQEIDARTRLDG